MNVIVTIEGKEAIPVRAIALLTDWEILSPDVCADAFSGNEETTALRFEGMATYRLLARGGIEPVAARWWRNWVVRELDACSKRIKAAQTDHETGYQQWRHDAFRLMPAGVFVWRDDFEAAHQLEFGPDSMRARFAEQYDAGRYHQNFNPEHGPGHDWRQVALEGFESLRNVADAAPEWKEQSQDVQELPLMLLADKAPDDAEQEAAFFEGFRSGDFDLHEVRTRVENTPQAAAPEPKTAAASPAATSSTSNAWELAKPLRYRGYTAPLYRLLAAAHSSGESCPTAREALEAWRINPPSEIAQVLSDGINYYVTNGNTQAADINAIRKAIERMTTAR